MKKTFHYNKYPVNPVYPVKNENAKQSQFICMLYATRYKPFYKTNPK